MTNPIFLIPVEETIRSSWDRVSGSKKSFWAAIGLSFLIAFGIGLIAGFISNFSDILAAIINIIGQVISTLISMGLVYMGIRRAKDIPIEFKQMFYAFNLNIALRILGVYAIQFLIFFPLTLFFLFVPMLIFGTAIGDTFTSGLNFANFLLVSWGVFGLLIALYLTLRMLLSMAFVLDMNTSSWEAVKMSFRVTSKNELRLLAIVVIQLLALMVGGLLLGIGLIWTMPFSLIVYGMTYKKLRSIYETVSNK